MSDSKEKEIARLKERFGEDFEPVFAKDVPKQLVGGYDSRLRRLIAVEALKAVLAHLNFGTLARQITTLPGFCSEDTGRVNFFDDNTIIASVYFDQLDDDDMVVVFVEDAYRMIRSHRFMDFHPTEHGIDFDDPYIEMNWPIKELREDLEKLAILPLPPEAPRMRPRPVNVVGGPDDEESCL